MYVETFVRINYELFSNLFILFCPMLCYATSYEEPDLASPRTKTEATGLEHHVEVQVCCSSTRRCI